MTQPNGPSFRFVAAVGSIVTALVGCDDDAPTRIVSPPTAPQAPSALIATPTAHNEVTLTWTDTSTNETGFEVERAASGVDTFQQLAEVAADVTTYVDMGLDPLTDYEYRVRAINSVGASEYSGAAMVSTPAELATTPDIFLGNFQAAWSGRRIELYSNLLDNSFVFYFSQQDVNGLGVPVSWGRAAELASATKMFSGQPGTTPGGQPVRPIESISLALLPETLSWDSNVPVQYSGTLRRTYSVAMNVQFAGGGVLFVQGLHDFYVAPVLVSGQTLYRLRYWVDFGTQSRVADTVAAGATIGPDTAELPADDSSTWGAIKANF